MTLAIDHQHEVMPIAYLPIGNDEYNAMRMSGKLHDRVYSYLFDKHLISHCGSAIVRTYDVKAPSNGKKSGLNSFTVRIIEYDDFACCAVRCKVLPNGENAKKMVAHNLNQLNILVGGGYIPAKLSALVYYTALGMKIYTLENVKNKQLKVIV